MYSYERVLKYDHCVAWDLRVIFSLNDVALEYPVLAKVFACLRPLSLACWLIFILFKGFLHYI